MKLKNLLSESVDINEMWYVDMLWKVTMFISKETEAFDD